jgi:alpha-methylacyl-CoA racemase
MTGWGQDGPLASSAGHDIGYIALTGALHAIGRADGPPQVPVNYLGDFGGGSLFLALGLVAGLFEARVTGRGRVVDAAIVDGASVLQSMTYAMLADGAWADKRGVNLLDTGAPFYDVYQTSDGRHMAVGALEPQFYAAFTRILFAPEPVPASLEVPRQNDRDGWPEMRRQFAARFAGRSQQEWTKAFSGTDACVAPVRTMTEAPADPQLAARGSYVTVDGTVQPAPAPRFGDGTPGAPIGALTPGAITRPGAHTRAVLAGLGFDDAEELIASGAAYQA